MPTFSKRLQRSSPTTEVASPPGAIPLLPCDRTARRLCALRMHRPEIRPVVFLTSAPIVRHRETDKTAVVAERDRGGALTRPARSPFAGRSGAILPSKPSWIARTIGSDSEVLFPEQSSRCTKPPYRPAHLRTVHHAALAVGAGCLPEHRSRSDTFLARECPNATYISADLSECDPSFGTDVRMRPLFGVAGVLQSQMNRESFLASNDRTRRTQTIPALTQAQRPQPLRREQGLRPDDDVRGDQLHDGPLRNPVLGPVRSLRHHFTT